MCRSNDPIPEVQTSRPWQNAEWVRKVTVIRGSYSQSDDSFPTVTMFRQVPKLWYNGTINKSLGSQGWAYMILLQLKVLVLRVAVNKSKHRHDNGYPWISWITRSHHQPKCLRMSKTSTLPESNITPENWCLGDYFHCRKASFRVRAISLPECILVPNLTIPISLNVLRLFT